MAISLKDSWQAQRQQRQQQRQQRQQQVDQMLLSFQHERQLKAATLRDRLALFQQELQQETQALLLEVSVERQSRMEDLTERLHDFTEELRAQTAEFLAMSTANRQAVAAQISQDLGDFHTQLIQSVVTLRQMLQTQMGQIQADVLTLRTSAQLTLQSHQQERVTHQIELMQSLAHYVNALQADVQGMLTEFTQERHQRAAQIQVKLQQERDRRMADTAALFDQLAEFRSELKQYCTHLHAEVWGTDTKPSRAVVPAQRRPPTAASTPRSIRSSRPVALTQRPAPRAIAPSPKVVVVQPAVVQPVAPEPVAQAIALVAPPTPAPVATTSEPAGNIEEELYNLIYVMGRVRLTEIQSALGISRSQALDALRLLIKQGLVIQRDRAYQIQEEVNS